MLTDHTGMYASLDDVEFLSRSSSRAQVLDAVTDAPRTRHELRELTGSSRVTVNRILDDLEDRGWIVRDNGRAEPTAEGSFVAAEFSRLLENMDAAMELDGAMAWLPTDAFDFDLACLADAEVHRTSDWEDHTATISAIAEWVHETDRIRGTAIGFSHEVVGAIRDRTQAGETTFEAAIDEPTLAMIRHDAGLRDRFQDVLASDHGTLALYTGDDPLHMVMAFDETVVICGHVDDGPPPGTVQTADPTVRAWADAYSDSVLAAATPITADTLTADDSPTP